MLATKAQSVPGISRSSLVVDGLSYSELDPSTREIAEKTLTRKQLDVFKLWCAGAGTARIAGMLGIAEATARAHKRRALQKIKLELEKKEAA